MLQRGWRYFDNKISEMIEYDVLGDTDEEVDVPLDDKVNINSQLAFWIAVLQRYSTTGEAQNFKSFVYLLLVIPAHIAGLERMFKILKEMKSKARNRPYGDSITTLTNFIFGL